MSKNISIKNSLHDRLKVLKFKRSFSTVIEEVLDDRQNIHRENGLLKRELEVLKLEKGIK